MRVVCAMSGGVDSSVAAALLRDQGHEVIGLTMRLYDAGPAQGPTRGRGGTCCSPAEIDRAKDVCADLGIPHYTVDERRRFAAAVIDDFAREYAAGRTPNPCIRCNEQVKFGPLLARATALGAEFLATGHYARTEGGVLRRGVDPAKDQSYFLFAMDARKLARIQMPLGTWTKDHVRERARELGLINADTPDSQELCFVSGGSHGALVESRARDLGVDTEHLGPGVIVDREGRTLGEHDGIHRVTVGQRRGLRIAGSSARYVLRVIPELRQVVVGGVEDLAASAIEIADLRRLAELPEGVEIRAEVQIRHRAAPVPASIVVAGERAKIRFDQPVRAVAPGQAAVIYRGDQVLGGGWIVDPSEVPR